VTEREERIAHVGEDLGEEGAGRASGTFSVHWEDRSRDWRQGPEGVDVETAIEWGRQHADVVLVNVAGEGVLYSAGARNFQDEDVVPWPDQGIVIRPRPIGTPLDGTVQERAWDVEARLYVDLSEADAERLIERIEGDTRLSDATVERVCPDRRIRASISERTPGQSLPVGVRIRPRSDGCSATCEYSFAAGSLTAAVLESEALLAAALQEINPSYGQSDIETSAEYGG
jgi:hypothetical protein